ncbi:stage V sporulation protein T [Irregularibacter muris]|nr:stage V sporulation protein T [Irregularibacter muris]
MKATGIVRRIDDLGRVVIPKEIRRTMRIREGDPLEIYTDREGEVILKKYSPIGELSEFANEYAESLQQATGHVVCISDKDNIIAVVGASKKEYMGKKIGKELEKIIEEKKTIMVDQNADGKIFNILEEQEGDSSYLSQVIAPIVSQGDTIGSVVLLSKESQVKMGDVEKKLAETAANFLGKQMEQ